MKQASFPSDGLLKNIIDQMELYEGCWKDVLAQETTLRQKNTDKEDADQQFPKLKEEKCGGWMPEGTTFGDVRKKREENPNLLELMKEQRLKLSNQYELMFAETLN